jgi:hypothetical protein
MPGFRTLSLLKVHGRQAGSIAREGVAFRQGQI